MPSEPALLLRHHRPFIAFWLARIFTASGFQMLTVAIGWNLYQLTGNVLDLGLVGLVEFIPRVLFMLHTGHVADRYERRRVAAICQTNARRARIRLDETGWDTTGVPARGAKAETGPVKPQKYSRREKYRATFRAFSFGRAAGRPRPARITALGGYLPFFGR